MSIGHTRIVKTPAATVVVLQTTDSSFPAQKPINLSRSAKRDIEHQNIVVSLKIISPLTLRPYICRRKVVVENLYGFCIKIRANCHQLVIPGCRHQHNVENSHSRGRHILEERTIVVRREIHWIINTPHTAFLHTAMLL